jgi:predicted dienelactone hydrolase
MFSKTSFGLISKNVSQIKTCCYQDINLSKREKNYPVVFFNHGLSSYVMQNTILCSDLASSGFIVIAIGHPYESSAVKFLDGRIIKGDKDVYKSFSRAFALANKKIKLMAVAKATYSDSEVMQAVTSYYESAQSVNEAVQVWVDDSRFVAGQMEKVNEGNISSQFKNKLKLELGIAITGHSHGGAVAAQTCWQDTRFACGIDIDGGSFGSYLNKDIKKPFMVLGSYLMENLARTTYLFNTEDTYMTILENTAHLGFSDALFFARQLAVLGMIGKRDRDEFREMVSAYHLKFFEKYLLGNRQVKLGDLKYGGVKFLERLKK